MKKTIFTSILAVALASCVSSVNNEQFIGSWIEQMPNDPYITQGVTLNADGSASSIGMATLLYDKWEVSDGKMILSGKSLGNGQTIQFSDTMDIVKIVPDTMILAHKYITGTVNYINTTYIRSAQADSIKTFNVQDSLSIKPDLGAVETRYFQGLLPAADCAGIDYKVWIYNQPNSGDGVYKSIMTYLGADNGRDMSYTSFGRLYTLRGNASDKNATIYQLIGFTEGDTTNFLLSGDKIEMLDADQNKIPSELNYTLTLQK